MKRSGLWTTPAAIVLAAAGVSWGDGAEVNNSPNAAFKAMLAQDPTLEYDPYSVLVRFTAPLTPAVEAALLQAVQGQVLRSYTIVPNLYHVQVGVGADAAIAFLSGLPGVDYAEHDWVVRHCVTPNDPLFGSLWGLNNTGQTVNGDPGIAGADINAPEGWNTLSSAAGVAVAVIDTGTQYTHPDLAANIWTNPGEIASNGIDDDSNGYVDDIRGWDFFSGDNNPDDGSGHGSHTSGTVGAVGNNGVGVTGVAWSCQIVPLRFLGPFGGSISDAILAVQYCQGKGIKVSNNSWSGGGFSSSLSSAIVAAQSVGHVFVCAAGNDGRNIDTSTAQYPAGYTAANLIAVAALTNNDTLASFSNTGAISVDLGAPGVTVLSTWSGNQYAYADGTSMASPHVAGAVALVYAQNPGWTYGQVKSQILNNTRAVAALAGKSVTGGSLNLQTVLGGGGVTIPPPPSGLTTQNLGGGQAKLTWADNSGNETGFRIERQQRIGGVWGSTTTLPDTAANVTMLTDTPGAGTFRYRVASFNTAGVSAFTGWVKVKVN